MDQINSFLPCKHNITSNNGNWTTRGYGNSQIANSWSRKLVDWTSQRLNNPWMPPELVLLVLIS